MEQWQTKYKERCRSLQHEMERKQGKLSTAHSTIKKLEEQLTETQVAKDELMVRLEESKNLETGRITQEGGWTQGGCTQGGGYPRASEHGAEQGHETLGFDQRHSKKNVD